MKKIFLLATACVIWIWWIFSLAHWQSNTRTIFNDPTAVWWVEGVGTVGTDKNQGDSFINVVKSFVNWSLGIIALIALIVVLYGGFLMVSASWNDEQYKKWFTILKQAAMWLILIGIAWFIVSIIFYVINLVTTSSDWQPAWTWWA